MVSKSPVNPQRIRNIRQCTFGWVDHNFLHRGFLNSLSQSELLLYYFLITVADRNGVSYYDYQRICQFLKLELNDYLKARERLCERSLIAFENGIYQVLSLPLSNEIKPVSRKPLAMDSSESNDEFKTLRSIFKTISD